MDIMESIYQRAKATPQRVAFPEATEEKILQAARTCADQGICRPVLVGDGWVLTGFREAEWAAALGKA